MAYAAGVDVGSTQTKAIILNGAREIMGRSLVDTGAKIVQAGERAFAEALRCAHLEREEVGYVVGTGYGRFKVTFGDDQVTEIGCHARGAKFIFPGTRTVIDMGGQDCKGISVGDDGGVLDFVMNDKCAAGTGRFLVNATEALGLSLEEIGPLSLQGKNPVRLSTVCTVFVESDIMSYLGAGKKVEDILAGVHGAIAARTVSLLRRVSIEEEVTFTGGVSLNIAMVAALDDKLDIKLNVSAESQFMGAIGAALFALERSLEGALGAATA